ncbi:MAG: PEGA domain-containing protein [Parcubacteria group bacterium]|jgi:endonuclease YncB( thermonuclease family)
MADDATDIKARALVMNVMGDIWQLGLTRDRGRDAMNNKMPAIPFMVAAREEVAAAQADLDTLTAFVSENASDLDPEFYARKIASLQLQLDGFNDTLPVPQLTVEEEASEEISGTVTKVDDGDTIFIGDKEIRLAAIDSPEKGTERGQRAKEYLENLVLGKHVIVKIDKYQGVEIYGRVLGVVFMGDTNVNLEMVRHCLAEPNTKFGRHNWVDPEEIKRAGEACTTTYVGYGIVKVYSSKTNSSIYVDGEDTGKVTPAEIDLPVGRHEIMCTTVGSTPDRMTIDVKPGKVEVKLFPITMPANSGLAEVSSVPPGAEFVVDDVPMGQTPTTIELSSDQQHVFAFYMIGYSPDVTSLVVPAGRRVAVNAVMQKE